MTDPKFPTHDLARKAGWFSRRHQTDEAHRAARETYQHERGEAARVRRATERST